MKKNSQFFSSYRPSFINCILRRNKRSYKLSCNGNFKKAKSLSVYAGMIVAWL